MGEVNPFGSNPAHALFPLPSHATGGRLAKILGLSKKTYLRTFDRVNLCVGTWSDPLARRAAAEIVERPGLEVLILLGRRVVKAFGVAFNPFTVDHRVPKIVVLPHPSGLNRMWNRPGSFLRAREAVLEAGVQLKIAVDISASGDESEPRP